RGLLRAGRRERERRDQRDRERERTEDEKSSRRHRQSPKCVSRRRRSRRRSAVRNPRRFSYDPAMEFPSTHWSRILRVEGAAGERAPDLDALARSYWRPVQAWLRASARCAGGEADDAAQDFFVWLIERARLATADPARGRFRALLKTMLRHFVVDRERRRSA